MAKAVEDKIREQAVCQNSYLTQNVEKNEQEQENHCQLGYLREENAKYHCILPKRYSSPPSLGRLFISIPSVNINYCILPKRYSPPPPLGRLFISILHFCQPRELPQGSRGGR
ncbi:hypothetical protein RHMOL_Rhmol05G0037700 [Rhododendron molle]|uniref:Uncharacterized protein n=1 Tax=Rhododendron molle TaxID=49168 RepID=A0ACC0NLS9_RHOML|nr:hypothetical protein RHMOL_Rhmol05G0037700 [Rhododendron molle]